MLYETLQIPTSGGNTVTLDAYCPDSIDGSARPGVSGCGGGGYSHISPRESEPVALRFTALGFNAYVIHYRVAPHRFPAALQDIGAAVACVRANAAHFCNAPDAIAVLGFSAGGHAAGSLGVFWQEADLFAPLGMKPEDVRPNALVLCYPVITSGAYAHRGSFVCLTGTEDEAVHALYSLEKLVTPNVPPTFLWSTWADTAVPAENTLLMASALRAASVPGEVHIFPDGPHGLALGTPITSGGNPAFINPACAVWPELAAAFLRKTFGER